MFRDDALTRSIEQLGQAVTRVVELLDQQRGDDAEREITSAERVLGVPPGLDRIDAASAAMMLGGGDRVVLVASLLDLRARSAAARGAAADAARHRARAQALLDHATPVGLAQEAGELRERLTASRASRPKP